jgi:hypothetical protein
VDRESLLTGAVEWMRVGDVSRGTLGHGRAMSGTGERDRDEAGRARSARPRDELGRPQSYDAPGAEPVLDEVVLPPAESLVKAQQLLDSGHAFHAHEVLEGTWKVSEEPERELWRCLAQLAVGVTHAQRGNAVGAARLLRRAADRVEGYAADPPYRIDVAGLVVWAREMAARIDNEGLAAITPVDLTPRLCRRG